MCDECPWRATGSEEELGGVGLPHAVPQGDGGAADRTVRSLWWLPLALALALLRAQHILTHGLSSRLMEQEVTS